MFGLSWVVDVRGKILSSGVSSLYYEVGRPYLSKIMSSSVLKVLFVVTKIVQLKMGKMTCLGKTLSLGTLSIHHEVVRSQ